MPLLWGRVLSGGCRIGNRLTIVQLLPALEGGGVERGTLEIAEALTTAGHRSLVVSAGGRLVAPLEARGSEHFEIPIGIKRPWVLRHVPRLRRLFAEQRVDIVHARSRLPAWLAWRALQRMRPRPAFVTTLHGLNSVSRYSSIMTRGDRVIAVSETARDYWLGHFPELDAERVRVINRGIDITEFPHGYRPQPEWERDFRRQYDIAPGDRLLGLPGRLAAGKGQADLIEVLARTDSSVLGLAVGEGRDRERQRIERLAAERGVSKRMIFTGHRSDMREVMAVCDIVLSLSGKPESFGRTVVEALALGRPVIGFDHGGVGEVLQRLYPEGRVAPGDLDALVQRIQGFLDSPPTVPDEQPYRKSTMQTRTLALYEELASTRSSDLVP